VISSAADYKFVTPDDIIIDGGIMPRRQGFAKQVLRGEDPAFIREAACRTAYLCGATGNPMTYDHFVVNTAPYCAGRCGKEILSNPLRKSAQSLEISRPWYATGQLTATPVFEYASVPAQAYTLAEALNLAIPNQMPDANTSFAWALSGQEVENWEAAVQAFRRPTVRYDTYGSEAAYWDSTGYSDQWGCRVTPTYLYDSENWTQTSGPSRRRMNLEAIYNECEVYTGDWSQFNGSITTTWNQNRLNEWYVYMWSPNHLGTQWTDRDGNVHAADAQLADSLLDKTTGNAQAVLDFYVYENLVVSNSGGNPVREKNVSKVVFEPCPVSWDEGSGYWVPDKASMYSAAFDALQKAGADLVRMADVTPPAGGTGGARTSVVLRGIHGIFTLDDGLVIQ